MASRSGFMHAPAAAGAGITACHLRGHSALVEEDQLLRRDGLEALEELFPPPAVLFAVAFDGVERLFFSRRPIWRSTCHRSEEHTSELQSLRHLVCRLLLAKKK